MGFSLSWIAFKDTRKAEMLSRAGLRETGVVTHFPSEETAFAFSSFPTGWSAIFSRDYRYGSETSLAQLSKDAQVLGVQIEEHMMVSAAALYTNGHAVWRIAHDSNRGLYDLEVDGTPPVEFDAIRARLFAAQECEPPRMFRTDYVYDVPVELAQALTGYRHDRVDFARGLPRYERLEIVSSL